MALAWVTFAPEPRNQQPGMLWVMGRQVRNPGAGWPAREVAAMRAGVGDRLLPDGEPRRTGLIIGVQNADGSPPYVVKWLTDGHIALVSPGPDTKVVRGAPAGAAIAPAAAPA